MNRSNNIDILKAICAFLIVFIHVPFPGIPGKYFMSLTRIAVPIFFMITGYYYSDTLNQGAEKKQIRKTFRLVLEANIIYLIWNIFSTIVRGENLITYFAKTFTFKNGLKFLLLNESPLSGHLWYLGAILYVLVIVWAVDIGKFKKLLYFTTPVLLMGDLLLGKYSIVVFRRAFPFIIVQNFLFVGIPYFCIGYFINTRKHNVGIISQKILLPLIGLFSLTSLLERFILMSAKMDAPRDHYFSTTFLAVAVFIFVLRQKKQANQPVAKAMALIGRKYSTWLYIIHPIFITVFGTVAHKIGVFSIYSYIAPIIVYFSTLFFLVCFEKMRSSIKRSIIGT